MSEFSKLILHQINNYKKIVKKYLPAKEYAAKINDLGLKGKSLAKQGEVFLFNLSHNLLRDLEELTNSQLEIADFYFGVDEFVRHLNEFLLEYRIHGDQIVHVSREASRSLVEAIQLISLPASRLDEEAVTRLKSCAYIVAKYGTLEQVRLFGNALKKHETKSRHLFYNLMEDFRAHVNARISEAQQ